MKALSLTIKRKRGVSIAEAIVSMAIILIVCATALGILNTFFDISTNMINRNEAISFAENSFECFKYAEDEVQFITTLQIVTGIRPDVLGGNTYYYNSPAFSAYMIINFYDHTADFYIRIVNERNDVLYEIPITQKAVI